MMSWELGTQDEQFMTRDYQYDYSEIMPSVYDIEAREKKAVTTAAVLEDFFGGPLSGLECLDVGGSTGVIDHRLAQEFRRVVGVDIDEKAVAYAQDNFKRDNLSFQIGDAMQLDFEDESFDVVICSHVYEHVPDAVRMMDEIYRVLRPGGVCFFAGNVWLMVNEPHYNLPFLSVLPRPLAHLYLRVTGKGRFYYEKHLSYGQLRKLVGRFSFHNYTQRVVEDPVRYRVEYMLRPGSIKAWLARVVARYLYWASPCMWVLEKSASADQS